MARSLGIVGLYFRPVVGWAMSERIDQQLVILREMFAALSLHLCRKVR
jgi:hypothetical protein